MEIKYFFGCRSVFLNLQIVLLLMLTFLNNMRGVIGLQRFQRIKAQKIRNLYYDNFNRINNNNNNNNNKAHIIKSNLWSFNLFGGTETDPGTVKGTKLKILKYPHPKLRAENEQIEKFDEELRDISQQMLLIMYASDGIGLAAPQVGINKRLMVFNEFGESSKPESEMILVNPKIISSSEDTMVGEEGCLSFPQIYGKVPRKKWIEVQFQSLTGEILTIKFEGKPSIIFQHEYDHLDKVLFIDRLVDEDKKINQKRLDKYVKKYGPGAAP